MAKTICESVCILILCDYLVLNCYDTQYLQTVPCSLQRGSLSLLSKVIRSRFWIRKSKWYRGNAGWDNGGSSLSLNLLNMISIISNIDTVSFYLFLVVGCKYPQYIFAEDSSISKFSERVQIQKRSLLQVFVKENHCLCKFLLILLKCTNGCCKRI